MLIFVYQTSSLVEFELLEMTLKLVEINQKTTVLGRTGWSKTCTLEGKGFLGTPNDQGKGC